MCFFPNLQKQKAPDRAALVPRNPELNSTKIPARTPLVPLIRPSDTTPWQCDANFALSEPSVFRTALLQHRILESLCRT